jgi:two-component system sensor histidine kinase QseC
MALRMGEPVRLVVASDRAHLDEGLWRFPGWLLAGGGLLAGLTLWLVPGVLWHGLRPLERLGEQAGRIDSSALGEGARFPVDGLPVELQSIARRLNDLLGRLGESLARERRFSANLAHELRTPLAELRSLAECAIKWPDARDSAMDHEVLAIARHMETLATHLLTLARGEQGRFEPALEEVDLAAEAGSV